ncbi:MAG: GH32 C-terminal domain-containing protein, partial [Erysipelotrichaceae bacterium]|nr:GH32 C-terminal domain-containing protein [Erysipelotrichaceae bacterium]
VLGARDRSSKGCVLVYESSDLKTWEYKNRIQTEDKFGYMWECPDLFTLEEKSFLITCPQGVKPVGYDYANVHQCGYFPIQYDFENHTYTLGKFYQLDRGFDFYAPQTFEDEQERRILIGWMGLPDIDYTNPTVERGWQHALTIPRELVVKDGKLLQKPIQEMETLRKSKMVYEGSQAIHIPMENNVFEMEISYKQDDSFQMQLHSDVTLTYSSDTHTFTLQMGKSGYGRDSRSVILTTLQTLRIYSDTSSIEIFLNDGEEVFTTRVYDNNEGKEIEIKECRSERTITIYSLNSYVIE